MSAFSPIGPHSLDSENEGSFWPSFTDIMMVVVLIFLLATSLLIVRNWNLVSELQQSIEAEKVAEQVIELTNMENATLEERLVNAEQLGSILRLRLLEKDAILQQKENELRQLLEVNDEKQKLIIILESDNSTLNDDLINQRKTIAENESVIASKDKSIKTAELQAAALKSKLELSVLDLSQAKSEVTRIAAESEALAQKAASLKQLLTKQTKLTQSAKMDLELATTEILTLNTTIEHQRQKSLQKFEQADNLKQKEISSLQNEKAKLKEIIKSKEARIQASLSEITTKDTLLLSYQKEIKISRSELSKAENKITNETIRNEDLVAETSKLKKLLKEQTDLHRSVLMELELATAEIAVLSINTDQQQKNIDLLEHDKVEYNRQLLSLKGDYDVIQSKYDALIKPARSAKGKYIAEVYYVKQNNKEIIRFKEPGDIGFTNLPLPEIEARLGKLKNKLGKDLYVKIIIPKNSGLSYNDAWQFMRELLKKYDYYYQGSSPE